MKVILIRHGKTEGNLEKRYIGKTDQPLCEEGRLELQNSTGILKKLNELEEVQIFTSPMKRCLETVKILFPEKYSEMIIIDDFRETDFGLFEGKNYQDLKDEPDYIKWMESNGVCGFPQGETMEQAKERNLKGFQIMLDKVIMKNDGSSTPAIAAVIHGGTIMSILSECFGGDFYDYQLKNGEGFCFQMFYADGKFSYEDLRKL